MDDAVRRVLEHVDREDPGGVRGVYLYGSAVSGGLRPDSDVDLLVLTARSLSPGERASLTELLLAASGTTADGARPLELTSIVIDDDRRWPEPAGHDFQYGEWLRAEILDGLELQPAEDPDVPILIATAHRANRVLRGPALDEVVAPVPAWVLRDAMLAIIPDILEEIVGDERNTLLAFARIITTLRTGDIVPKDAAAQAVAATLPAAQAELLLRARDGYLGESDDDWTGLDDRVTALSHLLADRARQLAADAPTPGSPSPTA